ncbi:hypothetical protein GTG28_01875 [Vibrio sp. OCN044]|uniref:Uncharacterized protein n=1 Tax=Vibrio tetraodonis subsp. pristinus TaxID=2695891 RepID=A0A6L8LPK5_9VIBR|nr:hypothetical protein [Vibrio tetraodonis]MYM57961.1 hypothetical protein [Vibrio tetraodonis subsp. pristinus]
MAIHNHHIDEAEFGLSVGISHLMIEKGELFYSSTPAQSIEKHWQHCTAQHPEPISSLRMQALKPSGCTSWLSVLAKKLFS